MGAGPAALAALAAALWAAPSSASGQTEAHRWSVHFTGGWAAARSDFSTRRMFREFEEEGRLEADYSGGAGSVFEAGLSFLVSRHVGVALSGSKVSGAGARAFSARFPHPLFFERDRVTEGTADFNRRETGFFLDLLYAGSSGKVGWRLFAGPALLRTEVEALRGVLYAHSYPYDEVSVTREQAESLADRGLGFSVGAGLDYGLGSTAALGAHVRFAQRAATLVPAEGDPFPVDVGGLHAGVALRIRF